MKGSRESNDRSASVRVLVGNSVYEPATVTLCANGWLFIEFDADDLDDVALGLPWAVDGD